MPLGNGTGPWGAGPMTGRGAGFCAGFRVPGYMNRSGFGGGFGRMGGRGWRHRFFATGVPGWTRFADWRQPVPTAGDQRADLKNEIRQVEEYLKELKTQMEDAPSPDAAQDQEKR